MPTAITFASTGYVEQEIAAAGGGPPGPQGQSAYQIAVANGFVGTQAQWLASLVGAAGQNGNPGQNGASGKSISAATGAPSGTANVGDLYINTATGDLYAYS